jgi:hypothetical protein
MHSAVAADDAHQRTRDTLRIELFVVVVVVVVVTKLIDVDRIVIVIVVVIIGNNVSRTASLRWLGVIIGVVVDGRRSLRVSRRLSGAR